TREIGIRMALGAGRGQIARMILGQALVVAGVGIVIGGIGAVGAAGWLRSQIPGVGNLNGWLLAVTAGVLFAAAAIAAYRPARRATRIDPLAALRQE
ncbi:MAG: FtsX-like permease family protein, partial [Terriglobales bacterium]